MRRINPGRKRVIRGMQLELLAPQRRRPDFGIIEQRRICAWQRCRGEILTMSGTSPRQAADRTRQKTCIKSALSAQQQNWTSKTRTCASVIRVVRESGLQPKRIQNNNWQHTEPAWYSTPRSMKPHSIRQWAICLDYAEAIRPFAG